MSKRVGFLAMLAVVAIVGTAAIAAQAGGDSAELGCANGYRAIGFSEPSADSYFPTPIEAAAAFLGDMTEIEGKQIPADVELVDVTSSDNATAGAKVIAARADGKTVALLGVSHLDGGWAVERDSTC
jgi:hypothetical protein